MNKTLEKEAAQFVSTRTKEKTAIDRTAVRYYAGCALTAMIQQAAGQPQEEILNAAFEWGIKAAEFERSRK